MTKQTSHSDMTFDMIDPLVPVRIACGLLYLPHIAFKLMGMSGTVAFFAKAGFNPPFEFAVLALVAESTCAIGLTFGILTKWIGFASAAVLTVAAYATIAAKGNVFGWLWNLGGIEYLVLWAGLSILVALHAWRQERAAYGRNFVLFPRAIHA